MHRETLSAPNNHERNERVQRLIDDFIELRASGKKITDDEIVATHPDLMPEIAEALQRLGALACAERQAELVPDVENDFSDTSEDPLPQGFPGYEIVRELHRGGQGIVYQAIQLSTKRKVALKVLLEGQFASEKNRRRFEREIELVASLHHPNIVAVFDSGIAHGKYWYAMDYIRGSPLDQYVSGKELSVDATLKLFAKICEAVNYANQRGVIHRDLKPGNIRVDQSGEPHVLDFGLAKVAGAEAIGGSRPIPVSITGQVIGTVPYMSPEQAKGDPSQVDIRTDVYSLGIVLYEMLTGRYPYEVVGETAVVLRNIIEAAPLKPSTLKRQIKDEVETIVLKALAKEPMRRYQSAGQLSEDVLRYLAGEPIEAKRDSGFYLLRKAFYHHRRSLTLAGLALLLCFAAAIGVFARRDARKVTLERNFNAAIAFLQTGLLKENEQNLTDAISSYRQAVNVYPQLTLGYYRLGLILEKTGKFRKALNEYQNGLRVKPDDSQCTLQLAWLLLTSPEIDLANPDRAIEIVTGLGPLEVEGPRFAATQAICLFLAGNRQQARESLVRHEKIFGKNLLCELVLVMFEESDRNAQLAQRFDELSEEMNKKTSPQELMDVNRLRTCSQRLLQDLNRQSKIN